MNPILILIADDHALVRAGIRAFLERIPNIEVVAEASDGREAVDLIAKRQTGHCVDGHSDAGLETMKSS